MNTYNYNSLSTSAIVSLLKRPGSDFSDIMPAVNSILSDVTARGDDALKELALKFDKVSVDQLRVSEEEFENARIKVDPKTKKAILDAAESITSYHRPQLPQPYIVETKPGVICSLEWKPIQRVGLYVPGGSAPLISTVLMLGIPASIAGCAEIIICTPPSNDGSIQPEILFAAESLGFKNVVKVGGAQAIAALAVGTSSIRKVDKIFGPGNRYVTAMKSLVAQAPNNVAIDMIAGPTELLIIADETGNPAWIAADLLSQAEHGADSQVVLVTTSSKIAEDVKKEINRQLSSLPRREVTQTALDKSYILIVSNIDEAFEFSNRYAPEHLAVAIEDADKYSLQVINAGSVFLGTRSSVVFGDYAAGTNHTLPTSGFAKSVGGVTVGSFMKPIFFQTISDTGLSSLSKTVTTLARAERLEAHARAVEKRMERS